MPNYTRETGNEKKWEAGTVATDSQEQLSAAPPTTTMLNLKYLMFVGMLPRPNLLARQNRL